MPIQVEMSNLNRKKDVEIEAIVVAIVMIL